MHDTQIPITPQDEANQMSAAPFVITVTKQEYDFRKITLVLFGIMMFFSSAFLGYLFLPFFSQGKVLSQQTSIQSPVIFVSPSPTLLFEATQKTTVATSLAVPDLYRNWIWATIPAFGNANELSAISADRFDRKSITIPFSRGKVYTATNSIISNPDPHLIDNYYAIQLMKLNWITQKGSYLTFQSFRLQAKTSEGPCNGITNYLGYKDEMVRVVTTAYAIQPCILSVKMQNGALATRNITYTVFISEPVSVRYLSNYVMSYK